MQWKQAVAKTPIICLIFASITLLSGTAGAGISDQLDRIYNGMTNTTNPTAFETQRRGGFAGGGFVAKSPIVDVQLINMTPPSYSAGCGGIDLYGGSFSFINSDQLISAMRAIASNAAGYAFDLALSSICESCSTIIQKFRDTAQALNQMNFNSCEMAQGIVTDVHESFKKRDIEVGHMMAASQGIFDGVTAAKTAAFDGKESSEKQAIEADQEEAKDKGLIGNIVWEALKKGDVRTWFVSGDTEVLETLLSLTGSVIKTLPEGAESATVEWLPAKITVMGQLVTGGTEGILEIYKCNDDDCMSPTNQEVNITGLAVQIENVLLGTGTSNGVVRKYAYNTGTLTEPEKALVGNLPSGAGTIIRNLAILNESSAREFVMRSSHAIALAMIYDAITQMFDATRNALQAHQVGYSKEVADSLVRQEEALREQYRIMLDQYGSPSDFISDYLNILQVTRKNNYAMKTVTTPTAYSLSGD